MKITKFDQAQNDDSDGGNDVNDKHHKSQEHSINEQLDRPSTKHTKLFQSPWFLFCTLILPCCQARDYIIKCFNSLKKHILQHEAIFDSISLKAW